MIRYILHQTCKDGVEWTSPDVFEARDERAVAQAVMAGALFGEPRWATDADTGAVLYALDGKGKEGRR